MARGQLTDGQKLEMRQELKDDHEPLLTEERTVRGDGRGSSLYSNIPSAAVQILDLTTDSDLQIEIYNEGFFVAPKDDEKR